MPMSLKEYFEGRAIKRFLTTLSPELKRRYGGADSYSYVQVKTTIEVLKLDKQYSDFAFFVFCEKYQDEKHGFHLEEIERYEGYRDRYFGGYCGRSCGGGFGSEGTCGGDGGG